MGPPQHCRSAVPPQPTPTHTPLLPQGCHAPDVLCASLLVCVCTHRHCFLFPCCCVSTLVCCPSHLPTPLWGSAVRCSLCKGECITMRSCRCVLRPNLPLPPPASLPLCAHVYPRCVVCAPCIVVPCPVSMCRASMCCACVRVAFRPPSARHQVLVEPPFILCVFTASMVCAPYLLPPRSRVCIVCGLTLHACPAHKYAVPCADMCTLFPSSPLFPPLPPSSPLFPPLPPLFFFVPCGWSFGSL